MTLILNHTDWEELQQQAPQPRDPNLILDEFEEYVCLPDYLGQGYTREMELQPGLWLDWADWEFYQDCGVKFPEHEHLVQQMVWLAVGEDCGNEICPRYTTNRGYLSGSGIAPGYTERYGRSQRQVYISIHLLPEVFAEFFGGLAGANAALLKVLLKQEDWKVSFFPTVTPAMRQVAQQMIATSLRGEMRRLYLQEKVFDLLSLQLEPLLADARLCHLLPGCKTESISRIYHARDVLVSRLDNPPALSDLARLVGTSDRTLRRGFRDLFGTTVVGFLMQQRLIQADLLLRERQCTVAEAASRFGYGHFGHFSAAFKQQFGRTPSECLAGRK
ncbi:MAG: helix-turn-helix transcriptional regulator [Leptolyngbyaceae cyanobacterium SU_3_3]|nr:helix-turn-helix transcriptional regulator [Leptolyngbyaceae cyanobacterium SU_3_3]